MFNYLSTVPKCNGVHAVCVQDGSTPLHNAARYGCLHIVRELIEKMNADILAQTFVRVKRGMVACS